MLKFAKKPIVSKLAVLFPALVFALTVGCSSQEKDEGAKHHHKMSKKDKNWEDKKFALANGSSADGDITLKAFFKEKEDGLKVNLLVNGLQPNAVHGIHIHENGVCNEPDFTSAGAHFDPAGTDHHGGPDSENSHLGDLGNVTAGPQGYARTKVEIKGATLTEGSTNVVGRSIVLHAGPDDFTSQPAGDSGGRLICAVIELGDKEKLKELKKDGQWKEWKGKDKKRKKRMKKNKESQSDSKPPKLEQNPDQKQDQPGSTTDAEI